MGLGALDIHVMQHARLDQSGCLPGCGHKECRSFPQIKYGPGRTGLTRAADRGSLVVPHSWDPALALTQHCTVPAQPRTGMLHFERECKRGKLLRQGGSCWESTEAAQGISTLSGDHALLCSLLALSALQARKVSHIPGNCPKRWKDVAEERTSSGGLALGALSQGKAHPQSMKHKDHCSLETTQCSHLY